MVGLKWKGFTLIETIVSGILISILTGVALVIYLNVSGSLARTQDLVIKEFGESELDSLAHIPGAFDLSYSTLGSFTVECNKQVYEREETVFLIHLSVTDSTGKSYFNQNKLVYETN